MTFDRFLINYIEFDAKAFIYNCIRKTNIDNKKYNYFRRTIQEDKKNFNRIRFDQYFIKNKILFYRDKL